MRRSALPRYHVLAILPTALLLWIGLSVHGLHLELQDPHRAHHGRPLPSAVRAGLDALLAEGPGFAAVSLAASYVELACDQPELLAPRAGVLAALLAVSVLLLAGSHPRPSAAPRPLSAWCWSRPPPNGRRQALLQIYLT